MAENLYRLKYPILAGTVVPKAKEIAADWLLKHQDLEVDIWAPHPDNAAATKTDFNGRIIRHSQRHVHVVGFQPAPEKPGRRREEFPDFLELAFPGEDLHHPHLIEAAVLNPLSEAEQRALGELAAALFTDPVIAAEIWDPGTAKGVTRCVRLPEGTAPENILAINYKLFPKK